MKPKNLQKKLTLQKTTISNLGILEMKDIKGGGASWVCDTDYSCQMSCVSKAALDTFGTWEYECQAGSCRSCPV